MTQDPPNPPTEPTAPETPAPKRKISRQDSRTLNNIVLWGQILDAILSVTDFITALTAYHYDKPRLLQILAIQQTARTTYAQRDKAIDDADHAIQALKTATANVRTAHQNYATILRPLIKDPATRQALRISGTLPRDLQLFIANLDAAYQTNLNNPQYLQTTTSIGYDAAKITALLDNVLNLNHLKSLQEQAQAEAIATTQNRNSQYTLLKDEMQRLLAVAKVASANTPAWSNLLNKG